MHKRVVNVLAISIRRAHRVFEHHSKLHHWSNSDTLKEYNKSIKKPKLCLSGTSLRQSVTNLRQLPVNLVRALLLLRFCGNSPQQLGFSWISIKANTIFEF